MHKKEQNLLPNYTSATNVRVRVRFKFWQNAHVRAMCVRPKIECANVRACEAKNRRNSQFANKVPLIFSMIAWHKSDTNGHWILIKFALDTSQWKPFPLATPSSLIYCIQMNSTLHKKRTIAIYVFHIWNNFLYENWKIHYMNNVLWWYVIVEWITKPLETHLYHLLYW